MTSASIQTVTGPIRPDQLGPTLMHEHLVIGYPGWESDSLHSGPSAEERFSICVDRIEELKALGYRSLVDPCPNDLGRDVELMARVAQKTGFQIICATGLYKEDEGGAPYWKFRAQLAPGPETIAELFVRELRDGIGASGVRAGLIKLASGHGRISDYERIVFEAAALAAAETGARITTHTEKGTAGDLQQELLVGRGLPAQHLVVGHSCGCSDDALLQRIACGGSYLGFDRFGLEMLRPDAERIASLLQLLAAGAGDRIVVSHDSVWCWRGEPLPRRVMQALQQSWNPTHFSRRIVPQLFEAGVAQAQIDALLVDNPRRFFAGAPLPALG